MPKTSGKNDVSAEAARARAHVDDMVRGADHFGVVLDDDERVARVAQTPKHADEPSDIAGVQADAWFVKNEQGIDQRRSQGGGQIDALHLSSRQRSRLAVQRQVGKPYLLKVAEPRYDFLDQGISRFIERFRQNERFKKIEARVNGKQHDIMDGKAVSRA